MENLMTEQIAEQQAETAGSTEVDLPVLIPAVGEQLRAAREKAGLQISEVALSLKLGERQLAALENGDWDKLPGSTFIRGFIRNYARLLGVDPLPLMTQLDTVLAKPATVLSVPESSTPSNVSYQSSGARDDRRFVVFGLLAALIAALVYLLLPDDLAHLREETQSIIDSLSRKEEPVVVPVAPAPAPVAEPVFPPGATPQQIMNPQSVLPADQPAVAPVVATEKSAPVASTAALSFEIVRESWIEVRDRDDKVIFSQRLLAGSQKSVNGNGPLTLVIGYAPGVKLQWRGQPVDLEPHSRGDVARLVLE